MEDALTTQLTFTEEDVPNFQMVSPTLYRGGQPSRKGFMKLKELGILTIVNLRDEQYMIKSEAELLRSLDLNYVSIPLSPFVAPDTKNIERFLEMVAKETHQPHFVHCLHGQDRTGTMVSLYRLKSHNWTIEQAYEEMLTMGFHPHFDELKQTVFNFAKAKKS